MLIYKAIFPNNKCYIGQAVDFLKRFKQHKYQSFNSNQSAYNSIFHKAIRKYGWENVKWEILEGDIQDETILNEREMFNILKYDTYLPNGYNMTLGGDGMNGWICSDETKNKIRMKHLGKRYSKEINKKKGLIGKNNPFYGKHHSEETIKKIKQSQLESEYKDSIETRKKKSDSHKGNKSIWYGKHLPESTREKIRQSLIGRKSSNETKEKQRLKKLGTKRSDETKRKMSIASRLAHLKRKSINTNKEEI